MVVASLVKHPPPETSRIYLTLPSPPSPLARDVISGWPLMHSSMIFSFSRKNQKFVISLIKVLCGKDVPKIKKQLIYTMKNFKWFRLNSLKLILESFKKFLGDKTCYEHILKINLTCVQSSDDVTLGCKKLSQFVKAQYKLHALRRIRKFLNIEKARILGNAFVENQCNYAPLIWMFCRKISNYKTEKKITIKLQNDLWYI